MKHFTLIIKKPIFASALALGLASISFSYLAYNYYGSGLTVEYFSGENFEQPIAREHIKNIFIDTDKSPHPDIPSNNFSARFYGDIISKTNRKIELRVKSDDGVRLWLNEVLILDDWNKQATKTNLVKANLLKGKNKLVLEYFDNIGKAVLDLEWKNIDDHTFSRIPTKAFRKTR